MIVISKHIRKDCFVVRFCTSFIINTNDKTSLECLDTKYLNAEGEFMNLPIDSSEFKSIKEAINCLRKYFPKERYYVFE